MIQEVIIPDSANLVTKEGRKQAAEQVLEMITEGHVDPIDVHLHFKAVEELSKRLTDKTKYPETAKPYCEALLDAAQKVGKSFERGSAKIEVKETGTSYDYSQCGDPVFIELKAKKAALEAKIKEREDLLKAAPATGLVITDQETGETYTVYPPAKTSTTSVAVTLK